MSNTENIIRELKETHLNYLYINRETCDIVKLLEALKETKVTSLFIGGGYQSDELLEALRRYLKDTNITHLSLSRVDPIEEEHISEFFNALKFSKITDLKFHYFYFEEHDIVSLSEVLKHTKIQNLDLSFFYFNTNFIQLLPGLRESSVTSLTIERIGINNQTFERFVDSLKFTKIKILDLTNNRINENGMVHLAENLKSTKIVSLNVSGNYITEKGILALIKCLKYNNIVELKLGKHKVVSKEVADELSQHFKLSNLENLQITFDSMQLNEIKAVFSACKYMKIKYLFLNSFSVECKQLPRTIRFSSITHLDLSMCSQLNLEDMRYLFDGLKDSLVEYLSLRYVACGSSGLIILSEYIKYTKIVELVLCSISNSTTGPLSNLSIETFMKALNQSRVVYLAIADNILDFKKFILLVKETKLIRLHIDFPPDFHVQDIIDGVENSQLSHLMFDDVYSLKEFKGPNLGNFLLSLAYPEEYLKITKLLYNNELKAKEVLGIFQKVVFKRGQSLLHFGCFNELVIIDFINNCLMLLKHMKTVPGIVSYIIVDEEIGFTKEEKITFLSNIYDEFALFSVSIFPDNVDEIVAILRKCELMGLDESVQSLLLHRPVFLIENNLGILHPYVYLCLHKYNMLMFSPDIEPSKKYVIIDYFEKHSEIKEGKNVVTLLKQT